MDTTGRAGMALTPVAPADKTGDYIFGHNIFSGRSLTFEPNDNAATPENYKLGPGDEVIIQLWGYNEATINQTISPEGKINISQIGPITLSGLTIKEASEKIRRVLVSKYAGIGGDTPNTSVSISLGQIRTIQVNIMGAVSTPGTYRLSSFSTVFHAIYRAGGVTATGSLRAIKVIRGGREIAKVDVYGYLFDGKSDSDISLQDGDIILVPPYSNLVSIGGNVKRPMTYEMQDSESLGTLLDYAGGFSSNAYRDDISVARKTAAERQFFTVPSASMQTFLVNDGDSVTVRASLDRYSNRVEIKGSVFRPGMYEIGGNITTVGQLVKSAGGTTEDAFLNRAVLTRENPDLTHETLSLELGAILDGSAADVPLRKNDLITISDISAFNMRGTLTINGYVKKPGDFVFTDNTSVEDLILIAGGLSEGASLSRVDIARRILDEKATMTTDTLYHIYSLPIKDNLSVEGGDSFLLEPYDVVTVHKIPDFDKSKIVRITGEVAFPGDYVVLHEGERVSDIIKRAGGVTSQAYLHGGVLYRHRSQLEKVLNTYLQKMAEQNTTKDSLVVEDIDAEDRYTVGVDLAKAVANPGSEYDLVLKDQDDIFIPEFLSTVRISGDVMYPNTVVYVPGKPVSYYIDAAGGYGDRAKRSKTFIVYVNGNVHRASSGANKVEPGCEIIVPTKGDKRELSTAEYISIGTGAASIATMVATILRLIL